MITVWTDLFAQLPTVAPDAPDAFLAEAARCLARDMDWLSIAREAVGRISVERLAAAAGVLRVPNVQPRVFPVHAEARRFTVVVNHYDRPSFDELFRQGYITPHYHHFSFCSRVLRGGLVHMRFENAGTIEHPTLSPGLYERLGSGDIFSVRYDAFHCVVAPEPDTLTLMIRTEPVHTNPYLGDPAYDTSTASAEHSELLRALGLPA
jgi:hypothetical protein